jgi:hypothetical protein
MLRKKGTELAYEMRKLDVSFHVGDGLALTSAGVTIQGALHGAKHRRLALAVERASSCSALDLLPFHLFVTAEFAEWRVRTRPPLGVWLEEFERVKKSVQATSQTFVFVALAPKLGWASQIEARY